MNPVIAAKFWVEGYGKLVFILHANNMIFYRGKDIHVVGYAFHIRRANKFHGEGANALKITVGIVEAAKLSAICVASYCYRQSAQVHGIITGNVFCQKN